MSISSMQPPPVIETAEQRRDKIHKLDAEMADFVQRFMVYRYDKADHSRAQLAKDEARLNAQKLAYLEPDASDWTRRIPHKIIHGIADLIPGVHVETVKTKGDEAYLNAYNLAVKTSERNLDILKQLGREFDEPGAVLARAADNFAPALPADQASPQGQVLMQVAADLKEGFKGYFEDMILGRFDIAQYDDFIAQCREKVTTGFKPLIANATSEEVVAKLKQQEKDAIAKLNEIQTKALEREFKRLKDSIKKQADQEYMQLMAEKAGFTNKSLWKRISDLDADAPNNEAIMSSYLTVGFKDGTYRRAGSEFSFNVKNGTISFANPEHGYDEAAYSEMMDMASIAGHAKTIVIDWNTPESVNFRDLKKLIAMATAKGLRVELGDNVTAAMVMRTKNGFLDGPSMNVEERNWQRVTDWINKGGIRGKVASALRELGRFYSGPTQVEIYSLLRRANAELDKRETDKLIRIDGLAARAKEINILREQLENSASATQQEKVALLNQAQAKLDNLYQSLIANPTSPNAQFAHQAMQACHTQMLDVINSLEDGVDKDSLTDWAINFKSALAEQAKNLKIASAENAKLVVPADTHSAALLQLIEPMEYPDTPAEIVAALRSGQRELNAFFHEHPDYYDQKEALKSVLKTMTDRLVELQSPPHNIPADQLVDLTGWASTKTTEVENFGLEHKHTL